MTTKRKPKPTAKRKPRSRPPPRGEPDDFALETSGEWTDQHTRIIGQLLVDLENKPKRDATAK